MPVPKRKRSRQRRDKRKANLGLTLEGVASCLTCQAALAPHSVCQQCGYYKGVKILRTKSERMHDRGKVRQEKAAQIQPADQSSTDTPVEPKS